MRSTRACKTLSPDRLTAALTYADSGYPVFPCVNGPNPVPLTTHGFLEATTDAAQIETWWHRYPEANLAIATKGLLVVDVDDAGNPWLSDQPELAMSLAVAPTSLTPGGGRHHIFRRPPGKDWRCSVGALAPHIDIRTDGGYIVVPPSIRPDGAYRWVEGCELDVPPAQLPQPPDWLMDQLDTLALRDDTRPLVAHDGNPIPTGQRNATLARLAGSMRRVGMSQTEIAAALQQVNLDRCVPPLPRGEVDRVAASIARYEPDQITVAVVEDHWTQMRDADMPVAETLVDPGPIPDSLLHIPGFVSEVMDYCLQTAPYPNRVMAFAGALALQAFLAGRKVRDPADNRTNLYLLGLAHSAAGKDWPRKINTRILHQVGLADGLGERFASGEGIQDALYLTPSMLFQTDEIDSLLQAINKARDNRHESIMSTLLTMYSSANSVYPMRRKAGKESPGVIDQPSLVIFGTAIPNHYYEALSERMLTNGLFARMIILECGPRGTGQEPQLRDIPTRVLETAGWWSQFQPSSGNLADSHPVPKVVPQTPQALELLRDARRQAETEYEQAERQQDAVGTTVWGRVSEQARKLALIHAVSQDHRDPLIGEDAARWAIQLVMHQTRRMLFMAAGHVAKSEFDAQCKELLRILHEWKHKHGDEPMPEWELNRRLPWKTKDHDEVRTALLNQQRIRYEVVPTKTRPRRLYRLLE